LRTKKDDIYKNIENYQQNK